MQQNANMEQNAQVCAFTHKHRLRTWYLSRFKTVRAQDLLKTDTLPCFSKAQNTLKKIV